MALSHESIYDVANVPLATPRLHLSELDRRSRQRLLLIAALILLDTGALLVNFALVYLLRFKVLNFLYLPEGSVLRFYSELVFWITPAFLAVFACYRLYDLKVLHGGTAEYRRIVSACTFCIIVLLTLSFFLDDKLVISRAWLLMVWVSTIIMLMSCRFAVRRVLYRLRQRGLKLGVSRVLFIGANDEMRQVALQLTEGRNQPGLEIVGFVGDRRRNRRDTPIEENWADKRSTAEKWPGSWLGVANDVRRIVEDQQVDEVIIASTALAPHELFEVAHSLTTSRVEMRLAPSLYEILTTGLEVQEINGIPLVTISKVRITGINAFMKRTMDIVVAAGVLLLFSPLILVVAALVKLDSPGPLLHRRRVVGQCGRIFDAFKLRTMRQDGDEILATMPELQDELLRYGKLKNDPRITRLGHFLRKFSLDELPQLFNVLLGQMSLVGPRMITYHEMIKFGRWQSNLMTVKPGLTGLWQVSGRSNLTYDDRVRLDMHYIRNYSLWSDLRILFQTFPIVVKGTGAY